MKYLNQLPKEAHEADFSRIKPWYLDGQSVFLCSFWSSVGVLIQNDSLQGAIPTSVDRYVGV